MARFLDELTTGNQLKEFAVFLKKTKKNAYIQFVVYGHIRKALGNPLAYPTPGNTYKLGPPLLTLEIIDAMHSNSALTSICPSKCTKAWAKIDQGPLTSGRTVDRYEQVLEQFRQLEVDIPPLTQSLAKAQAPLEQAIDDIYVRNYADQERKQQKLEKVERRLQEEGQERFRREQMAKEITKKMEEAKKSLEGHIKNVPFTYYKKLHVPNIEEDQRPYFPETEDVLIIGRGNTDYKEFSTGKAAVGIIVEKGTHTVNRDKYLKFKGITQKEMFDALKNTGWNMKNLKKPADLEKVG